MYDMEVCSILMLKHEKNFDDLNECEKKTFCMLQQLSFSFDEMWRLADWSSEYDYEVGILQRMKIKIWPHSFVNLVWLSFWDHP